MRHATLSACLLVFLAGHAPAQQKPKFLDLAALEVGQVGRVPDLKEDQAYKVASVEDKYLCTVRLCDLQTVRVIRPGGGGLEQRTIRRGKPFAVKGFDTSRLADGSVVQMVGAAWEVTGTHKLRDGKTVFVLELAK